MSGHDRGRTRGTHRFLTLAAAATRGSARSRTSARDPSWTGEWFEALLAATVSALMVERSAQHQSVDATSRAVQASLSTHSERLKFRQAAAGCIGSLCRPQWTHARPSRCAWLKCSGILWGRFWG
jgi:hypothetical protein